MERTAGKDRINIPARLAVADMGADRFEGKVRDLRRAREVVGVIAKTLWDGTVPAGAHLWTIPVDEERDWDCILLDIIDEVLWYRMHRGAPE